MRPGGKVVAMARCREVVRAYSNTNNTGCLQQVNPVSKHCDTLNNLLQFKSEMKEQGQV